MFVENAAQWTYNMLPNNIFGSVAVFVSIVLTWLTIQRLRNDRILPPGPWGIPILGYLPFMTRDVHLQFHEMAKKFGTVFCARLGTQLVVVISDYRIIRDIFKREEFTGRPNTEFINILGGYGIINTQGKMWRDQRRFLHDKLRGFGMTCLGSGRKIMEARIMTEVFKYLKCMSQQRGAPTNMSPSLGMSISNVICNLIMGVRFTVDDKRFTRFMSLIEEGFKLFGSMVAVNFIPVLRYLPWLQKIRNKLSQNRAEMAEFFQETVDEHRRSFDEGNMRDLVDSYLLEIKTAKKENRETQLFEGKNHDRQMQQILGDLFSAGMETVKTTLEWAMILMLHHPEAARAVQEELDQVVGRSRLPSLEDVPFLPVTEATILEVLRRTSIVPLGTAHATTRVAELNGYTIPSGTQIVPLLHAVHMDPELWDEPTEFRPARFITEEGKVSKPEFFMPFGVGRRMCLGDTLAKMELFLFFSSTLHMFDLRLPAGKSLPSLRGNVGVTVTPDPFQICLMERKLNLEEPVVDPELTSGTRDRNVGSH